MLNYTDLLGVRFTKHLTNLACWLEIENLVAGGPFSAVTLQGVSGYPELGRVRHDYWADCKRPNRRRWCSNVGSNGVRACTHSGAEK